MSEEKKAFERLKMNQTTNRLLWEELEALGADRSREKFDIITKFHIEAVSVEKGLLIVMVPHGFFFVSELGKFEFISKDEIERCYFLMNGVIG